MNGLRELGAEALHNIRGAGVGALREFAWRSALRYGARLPADPVLDEDWDMLVVLDACRADLWAEVVGEEHDLPVGSTRIAPGGTTTEWLETVFGGRPDGALDDLGYVTGNPYSDRYVDEATVGRLDEVWRYSWDDDRGTIRPAEITDAAIRAGRDDDGDFDRLIVHYMQPHFPSLADDEDDGMAVDSWGEESLSVWEDLRFGRRSHESVWESYRANLELVLEEVQRLLSNIDAERTVITADHGNAMGERGIYGHAAGIALRPLREVPWAVTTATDRHTAKPDAKSATADETPDVTEQLRNLGYR